MTLADVFKEAIKRDMSSSGFNQMFYREIEDGGKLQITFGSNKFPEATIEVILPSNGKPEEENYARIYFLSMVFNAAIYGMKRKKDSKNKNKK